MEANKLNDTKEKKQIDAKVIVSEMITYISKHREFYIPVYRDDIKSEDDIKGFYPLVYVWNENRETSTFTVSINVATIIYLLETVVPRDHKQFGIIKDKLIQKLKASSEKMVSALAKKTGFSSNIICSPEGLLRFTTQPYLKEVKTPPF